MIRTIKQRCAEKWLVALLLGMSVIFPGTASVNARALDDINVTPDDPRAGENDLYFINFFSDGYAITPTDSINFVFPAEFDLSKMVIVDANDAVDGGLGFIKSGQRISVFRDGTGTTIPAGTTVLIALGTIGNPLLAGPYDITISISDAGGTVHEGPATSNTFNITSADLDHFAIVAADDGAIPDQTAGVNFDVKIIAQDFFDNTVTGFTGTATLSDPSGTISPTTTGAFTAGILNPVSVNITGAQTAAIVTAAGSGESGASNAFAVNPGALASFSFSEITSPKSAGVGFDVSMTALDAFGNTATGFTGTANLTDDTGTVAPAVSGAFTAGVLATQSVTITQARDDIKITAESGGNSGQSNVFDVEHGVLSQYQFSTIASPQAVGVPFEIIITAQDANGNTADDFIGTVTMTPSVGMMSPTTSGSFINGIRAQQVTLFSAQTGMTISVDDGANIGVSNAFDLSVGPHATFGVTNLSSGDIATQQAGQAFNIRLEARDAFGNIVAGFNGVASLSIPTGTISPATTSNFTSGVLAAQAVSISQSQTGATIRASDNGISGSSNAFDVAVGNLFKVLVRDQAGGAGSEVGAMTLTADDELTVFAAGYDTGDNFVGDQSVTWVLDGLSGEANSGTGTSFTFRPTTANADGTTSGTIRADHPTAIDGQTGTLTILPGLAANALTITPSASTLPADGQSLSIITSDAVLDGDGNPAGAGRQFTVNVLPDETPGSITSADVNPTLPGLQVQTDASSLLNMVFQASTSGGNALISVNAVGAFSTGQTSINVGSIDLVGITAPLKVSRGQNGAIVNMSVQNIGASDFVISSADIDFSIAGGDESANYNETRIDAISVIPGGQTKVLQFSVDVNSQATLDTVLIDGSVSGAINGNPVSDNVAETTAEWVVQQAASANLISVVAPAAASQGQGGLVIFVTARNNFGIAQSAHLLVDDVDLTFRNGGTDVTLQYSVSPRLTNADTIKGNSEATFFFDIGVNGTATTGIVTINATIQGRDVNSGNIVTDNTADIPDAWQITPGAALQITAIETPQNVTAGLQGPWQMEMVVQNNGPTAVDIDIADDSTDVNLFRGIINVTAEFSIVPRATLKTSGTTSLASGAVDRVVFDINSTSPVAGNIVVFGSVKGFDSVTSDLVFDDTQDVGGGSFNVQSPADMRIRGIPLSQNTVTVGQTEPWTIDIALENLGQAAVKLDSFKLVLSDHSHTITAPTALLQAGTDTLGGNSPDTLRYTVTQTSLTSGLNIVDAAVYGREINRQLFIKDSTSAAGGDQTQFEVQTSADFRIFTTFVNPATAPNAPFINVKDTFEVDVHFVNTGEETVENLTVKLSQPNDGKSRILVPARTIPELTAGLGDTAKFIVVADSIVTATERFTASFLSGSSKNTGLPLSPAAAADSIVDVTLQAPAGLKVVSVTTSDTVVNANQTIPNWIIKVAVQDTGNAPVLLDPPTAEDIFFKINGNAPLSGEFTVAPPAGLKLAGGLTLTSGAVDTLEYAVTRTGPNGGTATISAEITGRDANDLTPLQAAGAGSIKIDVSAAVGITGTRSIVNHTNESGVGLVNTSQVFFLRVFVNNTSVEPIKDVQITLTSNSGSSVKKSTKTIDSLAIQSGDSLTFEITADVFPNAPGEIFTAVIDSAIAANSGEKARISAPFDATERVVIQRPASLRLNARSDPDDGKLTLGQEFTVFADIENLGDAAVDSNGKVEITLPGNYQLAFGELQEKEVIVGEEISWQVTAPPAPSLQDTIIFFMTQKPIDLNATVVAEVLPFNDGDTLVVDTDEPSLSVTSLSVIDPEGARDDTLSSGQEFVVEGLFNVSANLSEVKATLELPLSYDFKFADRVIVDVLDGRASWILEAPIDATNREDQITVRVFSEDEQMLEKIDSLGVVTISRAQLKMNLDLLGPNGLIENGSLTQNQAFTFRVTLGNIGEARTIAGDTALVSLDFGETGVRRADTGESLNKKVAVNDDVSWELVAPADLTDPKAMDVTISQVPRDENTGVSAAMFNTSLKASILVDTREGGSVRAGVISIVSPSGAVDRTVSTDQTFRLQAEVEWTNAKNIQGRIILPENAGYTVDDPVDAVSASALTGGSVLQWEVTAPPLSRPAEAVKVRFTGVDASDDTPDEDETNDLLVTAVRKAQLSLITEIVEPRNAAINGTVSPDQNFTVRASLANAGDADTLGSGRIRINVPTGYELVPTDDSEEKLALSGYVEWVLRSPATPTAGPRNITFVVLDAPRDENTGQILSPNLSDPSISILTENSKLELRQLVQAQSSVVVKGQQDVEMLSMKVENIGRAGTNNILLKGFILDFLDMKGEPVNADQVITALKVSAFDGTEFLSTNAGLGNAQITLNFDAFNVLEPQFADSLRISVNIADKDRIDRFVMRLNGSPSILAEDQENGKPVTIELIDPRNNRGENVGLQSSSAILISNEFATSLGNRPNPFNPANGSTIFSYKLNQASGGELNIYTMLGELVWRKSFSATDPEGRLLAFPNTITWDGKNGRGRTVLNGVYIAVLRLREGGATAHVKVAVVR